MEAVRTHQVLRDEVASRAGVDRSRLLFKVVQAWFNVQTGRVHSRFKVVRTSGSRGLEIRCKTSIPAGRSEEDHGTCRLRPNEASARVKARQAQTLRFFRLLRLLGPPQSSKPQRLLAASESEPTLATDSVLGARHQLPSVADTTKRVDRNSLDALTANFGEHVATASACIASTRIHQHHPSTVKPVEAQGRCENPGKRTDHLPDFRVRNRIHL